jgi:hypothetical protein
MFSEGGLSPVPQADQKKRKMERPMSQKGKFWSPFPLPVFLPLKSDRPLTLNIGNLTLPANAYTSAIPSATAAGAVTAAAPASTSASGPCSCNGNGASDHEKT